MPKVPTAPKALGREGRKLWRAILSVYVLRPDELSTLEDACRECDLIEQMREALDARPTLETDGSMGQIVAHPFVGEIRQHRAVKSRLLANLKLPDEAGEEEGERSSDARAAAQARWKRGA